MDLRKGRSSMEDSEINVTALIDVVLVLLIFFMVSTTFIRESEINLTLPSASKEQPRREMKSIAVSVDRESNYSVNGERIQKLDIEGIELALRKAGQGLDNPPVIISADANATHQSVINVLDAARRCGLMRVTFATKIEKRQGE
ncbi:MAG: ExbD/TolR family protein [Gammaproteobacteria bacterium]